MTKYDSYLAALTAEQGAAFTELAKLKRLSKAALLRQILSRECAEAGVVWPGKVG